MLKNEENYGTEEIGLETPTPVVVALGCTVRNWDATDNTEIICDTNYYVLSLMNIMGSVVPKEVIKGGDN